MGFAYASNRGTACCESYCAACTSTLTGAIDIDLTISADTSTPTSHSLSTRTVRACFGSACNGYIDSGARTRVKIVNTSGHPIKVIFYATFTTPDCGIMTHYNCDNLLVYAGYNAWFNVCVGTGSTVEAMVDVGIPGCCGQTGTISGVEYVVYPITC